MNEHIIQVNAAEFAIAGEDQILGANGVGSCVVVCLYERIKKIGALVHIMLPYSEHNLENPFIFADTAIPLVLMDLEKIGINKKMLEAHIIGGASMFTEIEDYLKLGEQNQEAAEQTLAHFGIPIKSKDVGGKMGRSVRFFLNSGEIQVSVK